MPCVMTRRQFLATTGGGLGAAALAGCAEGDGGAEGAVRVSLMAAGSLNNAFEHGLREHVAPTVDLEIEAHGSAMVARMVAEGQRDPDIVSLADTALFDGPLHPSWYAEFATNALVIAYNADTPGGQRIADAGAERWYEPIRSGGARLGRTDPDADPLGYRALFMLELASRHYDGASDLREEISQQDQIFPETGLISQFETGAIDAAIAYRSMSIERGYDYLDLPEQIDLSVPQFADGWYSTVSYILPGGKTVTGGLISYGTTVRRMSAASVSVFEQQISGRHLEQFGFVVPQSYPQYHGDPPRAVQG